MSEWRTMDSAPRDGTRVLGCVGGEKTSDYSVFEMEYKGDYGWQDPAWDGGYDPAFWMPRPAAPDEAT